jgi:hypothetical protein
MAAGQQACPALARAETRRPARLAGKPAPLPRQAGWRDRMADDQERRLCERHDHDRLTIFILAVSARYPAATVGQRPVG